MKYHIGIDLGGTKIELVVINKHYEILFKERVFTESHKGLEHTLNQIKYLYLKTPKEFLDHNHSIGVGTPGSISLSGKIINSTIPSHNGINLKRVIEKKLEQKIFLENDANCFVIAESFIGSAKNLSNVFGIILGTGCGGGLFIHNKLWSGINNFAGEWGHSTIEINGRDCFCGKKGCINAYISGSALENKIYQECKKKITAKVFLSKSKFSQNEKIILNEFIYYYCRSLSNIISILDPEAIVIGGGLSNFKGLYRNLIKKEISKIIGRKIKTKILQNKLGDSSGVLGAALLGMNN